MIFFVCFGKMQLLSLSYKLIINVSKYLRMSINCSLVLSSDFSNAVHSCSALLEMSVSEIIYAFLVLGQVEYQQIFGRSVSALEVDWPYLNLTSISSFLSSSKPGGDPIKRMQQLGLDLTFSIAVAANKLQMYLRML